MKIQVYVIPLIPAFDAIFEQNCLSFMDSNLGPSGSHAVTQTIRPSVGQKQDLC